MYLQVIKYYFCCFNRTYRDLILCTTVNIQVGGYPCSTEDIEMLVGKNMREIFGEMKFTFNRLHCSGKYMYSFEKFTRDEC